MSASIAAGHMFTKTYLGAHIDSGNFPQDADEYRPQMVVHSVPRLLRAAPGSHSRQGHDHIDHGAVILTPCQTDSILA